MMTFKELYTMGLVTFNDVDLFIDEWHESNSKDSLHVFLGLTEAEYKRWAEKPELEHLILEENQK